jgi:nucleoid-associated protein YgaU
MLAISTADARPSDSFDAQDVQFDGQSRAAHSEQHVPVGGVPRALREAAEQCGLDPLPQLYNEALAYATEGHLRLARERLSMLLCMAPDDGEARLLMAKVCVAGQRWADALAALDEAETCGQSVPLELRETIEHQVRSQHAETDESRAALAARERGEIKALRAEARRLRSENAQLVTTVQQVERETRKWAWTTAGVSGLSITFILGTLLFGGGPAAGVTVETDAPVVDASGEVPSAAPSVASRPSARANDGAPAMAVPDAQIASSAATALAASADLEGTQLEVVVDAGKAQLVGQVVSARQRKIAEDLLGKVGGVTQVASDRVEILARTRGTVHTVGRGDTFSHIAMQYYGSAALTKPIARANPQAKTLQIGDQLKIPAVD